MKTKLQPLADYVVAKIDDPATKTASGILLPESSAEKSQVAKVLAIGKDVKRVKIDDQIIQKGYSSTEVTVSGEDYILIKEEDIIATVN